MFQTSNLYFASAVIWATGIYPDRYTGPDAKGIIACVWDNDRDIRASVDAFEARSLKVEPRGFAVIHLNLKRKVNSIKGTSNEKG